MNESGQIYIISSKNVFVQGVKVKSGADLELEAEGNVKISAAGGNVEVNAGGNTDITSGNVFSSTSKLVTFECNGYHNPGWWVDTDD